jgi:hypothetical protein
MRNESNQSWMDVVARQVPLKSDSYACEQDRHDTLQAYIKEAAYATQHHHHTHTCKKGGRQGGHHDCRMNFDLPLVPSTRRLRDSTFAVRRDDGMLVGCIPGLQLAYPSNHLMQLTCEGSRFLRALKLWEEALDNAKDGEVG